MRIHQLKKIVKQLDRARDIIVTAHIRPDGDALGSALALARLLVKQGKNAVVALNRDEIGAPAILAGQNELVPTTGIDTRADLLVVLDCASLDRMPKALKDLTESIFTVNIDHHPTNTLFGDIQWIDSEASSVGEMICLLARYAAWKLDQEIAEALWVAIMTDTGRFAYESTSSRTMLCAAELLEYGVRTAWLNEEFYTLKDLRALDLYGRACESLELWCDDTVAVVSLPYRDFSETGCSKADAEDIIEIARSVRGAKMALFLYETEADAVSTRLSIRTRAPLDAIKLAERFGGGGHHRAAGATMPGNLRQAKTELKLILS